MSVLVHIVTYNDQDCISPCIQSVLEQLGDSDTLEITDNASIDKTVHELEKHRDSIKLFLNKENLGFCAAHNQAVYRFLNSSHDHILILNPDIIFKASFLKNFIKALEDSEAQIATPKLLRADKDLQPIKPVIIDAAGMYFTNSFRHFDRGSNQEDLNQFDIPEFVIGGTGAALLLSKVAVEKLILPLTDFEESLYSIYPQLREGREWRAQLFDEAFFAYREDAELALRSKSLGVSCLYVPSAVAYHQRVVLPERRSDLPQEINAMSVRNRFLMQALHLKIDLLSLSFWGAIIRNLLVIAGVLVLERGSVSALKEVSLLRKRAYFLRNTL